MMVKVRTITRRHSLLIKTFSNFAPFHHAKQTNDEKKLGGIKINLQQDNRFVDLMQVYALFKNLEPNVLRNHVL